MQRPLRTWTWVVMSAAVATAAGAGLAATPRGPTGATTKPALLPGIDLADAKALADLTPGDLQANFTDKLTPPQTKDQAIYFGEVDEYDGPEEDAKLTSALPIVAVKDGAAWKAVPVVGPGLANTDWRYVGAGPAKREVWGVLDTAVGDGGPDVFLVHSDDGGATYKLFKLHKPASQATVFDFAMSRDGRGRLALSLDESVGRARPGLYYYETTDDGQTWSEHPRFEPDAMIRADTVPDDEQPDGDGEGKKPSKTAWRWRATRPALVSIHLGTSRPLPSGQDHHGE